MKEIIFNKKKEEYEYSSNWVDIREKYNSIYDFLKELL
jgi:hypothetical protein